MVNMIVSFVDSVQIPHDFTKEHPAPVGLR